jgi:hypothetical protein
MAMLASLALLASLAMLKRTGGVMKYNWIVAHYEAMNKGGQSQSRTHEAGLWGNTQFGPNVTSNQEQWRVVPSNHRVPVDLSVLIDSGINCESDTGTLRLSEGGAVLH